MSRLDEVVNKAREHDAAVAERDALKEKVADLERKEREAAEAAYDAEVDTAREEERIGADEVPGFKALMRKDPENTRTLLAARKTQATHHADPRFGRRCCRRQDRQGLPCRA